MLNKTSEHIDADNFIKKIELTIFNSGLADLVESEEFRDKLRLERAQQQDFASSDTASQWGLEVGADLMLFGEMNSETDVYNNKRVVNYIITLFLTDIETNKRVWYGQKEIKKFIKNWIGWVNSSKVRLSLKFYAILLTVLLQSCATYYQTNYSFNTAFEQGKLEQALADLQSSPSKDYRKNEFLYLVNNGLLLSVLGRYEESNDYLEKAYLFGEDYRSNYLNEAASYLTNPMVTSYRGEDHEHLMVLYYKAMNFLKMGKGEEALVECKRLNIRLQQLSDRYDSDEKYQEDAFIHLLMGIIYEADNDFNNAFIAYRNSYNIYQSDYKRLFNVEAPAQLKSDIIRTALLSGLHDEYEFYKVEFDQEDYTYEPTEGGDLIFFWHNGLSPIKSETSINFVINRSGNVVTFVNEDLGFSFPFNVADYDEKDKNGLANLEVFRVAFPKYVERPVYYQSATVSLAGSAYDLQPAESIDKIAKQVLRQRMALEFSKALIRAALKKVTEYEMKKENKTFGSLIGIINAITEKADTRNWQTLPHSIYYSRVPLKLGKNELTLSLRTSLEETPSKHSFTYIIDKKGLIFHTFTSLESRSRSFSYY